MRANPRYTLGVHSTWIVNAGGALACVLLRFGYFLEYARGLRLVPCACSSGSRSRFSRWCSPPPRSTVRGGRGGARAYGVVAGIAAASGAGIAGWHIRLQNLPPGEAPECGPGLEYMLNTFPITESIAMIFTGSGECAEVSWSFLSLGIPSWALIWFIVLGLVSLANNFRTPPGFQPRLFD